MGSMTRPSAVIKCWAYFSQNGHACISADLQPSAAIRKGSIESKIRSRNRLRHAIIDGNLHERFAAPAYWILLKAQVQVSASACEPGLQKWPFQPTYPLARSGSSRTV